MKRKSSRALWMGCTLLMGCTSSPGLDDLDCDPRELAPGEVRVRRIPCSDELPSGGDARRGDWVLENDAVRYFIRDTPASLTRLQIAGGTVIDAVSTRSGDVLLEAVPSIEGAWFQSATVHPSEGATGVQLDIEGTLPDGSAATVAYRLDADALQLEITGADGLSIVPRAGTDVIRATLDDGDDLLGITGAVAIQDRGGWLEVSGATGLLSGDRDTVYEQLYIGQRRIIREAEGDWLEVFDETQARAARLRIDNGQVVGSVPDDAAWVQAIQAGHTPSALTDIDDDSLVSVGAAGAIWVRAVDRTGTPIPVTASWQGESFVHIPGDELLLTGPGAGTVTWFAGPGRELQVQDLAIADDQVPFANVVMPWVVTPGALVALSVVTSPDPTERRSSTDILTALAGSGVHYAVMVATDEVSSGRTGDLDPFLLAAGGSRSAGAGEPEAWPWSGAVNRPAHGAIDWDGMTAEDLLAAMSRRDNRTLLVRPAWLAQAQAPPSHWLPAPDILLIDGLDDLEAVVDAHDRWAALSLAGPLTWVDGVDPRAPFSVVDVEAGLLAGRTTATNGPRLHLSAAGAAIGEAVVAQPPIHVEARVEAPTWMPLTEAALIGPGGAILERWSLSDDGTAARLFAQVELNAAPAWLLLAAWGDEANPPWLPEPAWAVTSAVWLDRP